MVSRTSAPSDHHACQQTVRSSPWSLSAHVDPEPHDPLGGPSLYQAREDGGSVKWILPGKRSP